MDIKTVLKGFENMGNVFICPICKTKMEIVQTGSFVCEKKHCFDISKKGYVNFLPSQKALLYDKKLFEMRQFIFSQGFYQKILDEIKAIASGFKDPFIIDAGCGEGYYSFGLKERASCVLGLDISKEAIFLAKASKNTLYAVSDIASLPLSDGCADIVLNILTPANYAEFSRVLKNDGIIIKIIPCRDYLIQIRNRLPDINKSYSNKSVIEHFEKHTTVKEKKQISYTLPVDKQELNAFIKMTPMLFGIDVSKTDFSGISEITIDLMIITGRKKPFE
ncbi:MAG: methyltransferase domain-containing protein [Lachnospiraceae bacterium]|nr:methyltransferase domain-containing protein [Lachnospiraceae bacterium]